MDIYLFIQIATFFFGLIIGSFLNVCIYRLPREQSIVHPGSCCPECKEPIRWYDNIPLISFIALRGKCRGCARPISWRYPIVELLTGLVCTGLFYLYGPSVPFVIYFILSASLIVVTMIDVDFQIIPNVISIPGILIGFALSFLNPEISWKESALGILVGGGFLALTALGYYLWTKEEGMGMGDVKLLAMIGAFLGIGGVFFTILLGSIVGSICGIFMHMRHSGDEKMKIPFGPFLSLGAVCFIFFGRTLMDMYLGMFVP
ncbi:MAG: prepilin peptidase [Deltaproteobacteria bacterium]|nr:prepilin peptidase [Candidatus Zymogenaceae bacterium]